MKNKLKKDLSWEIEVLPVQIKGQTKVLNKALVRSDDQKLIGIRSRYYKPVFNKDLEAIKEKILNTGGFSFKGYEEFKRGKRILAFFENKKKYKLCGERVEDYLIIGNSNDGSSKLFIGTSNYMYRCENMFSSKIRAFERRHDRTFDIDAIDPSYAPGTGTPEIGGFTSYEAQRIVRKLAGLNLIGADLVEVSPPFDPTGGTAWVGVSIMFELLCVLATATEKVA